MMRSLLFLLLIFFTNLSIAQLQFGNVATTVGANFAYGDSMFGGGVSFVDFNGDGLDDLTFSTDETQNIHFLQNNGGSFTKVTLTGINETSNRAKQVLWVDYDNDGDKDFFVTNLVGKNGLYQNDGNMVFTNVTTASGLFTEDLTSYGATFGDIDNDGDLDLFITNREGTISQNRNYLYRNDNGLFFDITATAGINTNIELTFGASFFDYDNDGDQDLYIINDKIDPNYLYQNDGTGQFTDVSLTSAAGINIDAMSCTIGDYDADGFADIYVSNTMDGNQLLKNNGGVTFTNIAADAGVEFESFSWGATFLDADNDSNLDLYVSSSFDGSVASFLSAAFYHNNGDDTFTIPNNIGFSDDERESYSNAVGDFNNDGKPDIVVMNDTDDYFLWENQTTTTNNWIKIKLEGVTSNKDGIGNRIEVFANGKSQYKFTVSGEGYLAQNSQYEFVGVGNAANIDYVKVTWNKTGIIETINNIQPNQAITIQEGNGVLSTSNELIEEFKIYPNPSNTGVYQFANLSSQKYTIQIYTTTGKLVLSKIIRNNTDQLELNAFSKGIYIAKIISKNRTSIKKLIHN
tara:strand:+ start:40783 stop:42507 length:1725 start_codon:yes stop_codon:yes gene_type:complete